MFIAGIIESTVFYALVVEGIRVFALGNDVTLLLVGCLLYALLLLVVALARWVYLRVLFRSLPKTPLLTIVSGGFVASVANPFRGLNALGVAFRHRKMVGSISLIGWVGQVFHFVWAVAVVSVVAVVIVDAFMS